MWCANQTEQEFPNSRCEQAQTNGRAIWSLYRGEMPECRALQTPKTSDSQTRLAVVLPWVQANRSTQVGHDPGAPPTAGLWIESAAANADLADFFIIFDEAGRATIDALLSSHPLLPHNVRRIEVASVAHLYETRLNLTEPILATDVARLKPCMGHVFEHHLAGYSHWAYGDLDVVYGSLRRFLTPSLLQRHAIITLRDEGLCGASTKTWFAGQFTVFRNIPWVNALYRTAPGISSQVNLPLSRKQESRFDWRYYAFRGRFREHYDERGTFPLVAAERLRRMGSSVAYLASQISDLTGLHFMVGDACEPGSACGRLVWVDGRVLHVEDVNRDGIARTSRGACIRSEAALLHLGRTKYADTRQCRIASSCGVGTHTDTSWRWLRKMNRSAGVEIRTPGQRVRLSQRWNGTEYRFGFEHRVGLRQLHPSLAKVVRDAERDCRRLDAESGTPPWKSEYLKVREWVTSRIRIDQ